MDDHKTASMPDPSAGDDLVARLRREFYVKRGAVLWRPRTPERYAGTSEPEALCQTFNTRYGDQPAGFIKRGKRVIRLDGKTWPVAVIAKALKTGVAPAEVPRGGNARISGSAKALWPWPSPRRPRLLAPRR
jgi:hypothetical protein